MGREATGVETCGCDTPPRRRCDLCRQGSDFLACGARCLEHHRRRVHPADAGGGLYRRLVAVLERNNRDNAGRWERFAAHRTRLTRLLGALQRQEGLCVLGAGNGDDLDLPALLRSFGDVHLADLDGEALRRAHARVPPASAGRITLHGGLDFTGVLATIDDAGDDDARLAEAAAAAARDIPAGIGRTFDVVLSDCVLSQLATPLGQVLARGAQEWSALLATVACAHLATAALLTRPGGWCVLLGDALYAKPAPEPPPEAPTWQTLAPEVAQRMVEGPVQLRNPQHLMSLLAQPALANLVESPRLTEPWLWQLGDMLMLVYAIMFQRPGGR